MCALCPGPLQLLSYDPASSSEAEHTFSTLCPPSSPQEESRAARRAHADLSWWGGGRDTFEPRPLPLPPSWPCWELMEPVEGRYRGCVTGVEPCYRVALLELKETRSVTQGAAGRGPRPSLLISGPATSWCSWPCCFWGLSCRLLLPGAVCAWAALGHPPDTPSRSLRFLRPGPTPLQLFSQSVFRTVELVIPRDRVSAAQDKLVASALLNTIHRPLS